MLAWWESIQNGTNQSYKALGLWMLSVGWLQGFVSNGATTIKTDYEGIEGAILQYCEKNPSKQLSDSAINFLNNFNK